MTDRPGIIKELTEITREVARLETQRHETAVARERLQDQVRILHAKALVDVALAKDAGGKALYTSEATRQAAVTVRLSENDEYRGLVEKIQALRAEEQALAIKMLELEGRKEVLMLELGLVPSSWVSIPGQEPGR
jgi:hypothetical protein